MNKKKLIIWIIVITSALILSLFAINAFVGRAIDKNDDREIVIKIENGSSTAQIAKTLKENDTIRSEFMFRLNSKLFGYNGKYKAGSFIIKRSMSMRQQMDIIRSGVTTGKKITIIEGYSLDKIGDDLENKGIVSKENFLKEAANGEFDYEFLKDIPKGTNRLEGFLYPDTYMIDDNSDVHSIINTALNKFDEVFTSDYYEKLKKKNLNIREIMTIASIVEREGKTKSDKKKIASVIYNRLAKDMPLQMDATLNYIMGVDKVIPSIDDTKIDSPYNTYLYKGLPPTPIGAAGKDAIDAAINPDDTDYLYYVVSEKLDGTHVFSKDYDEFLKNVEKFHKAYEESQKKN